MPPIPEARVPRPIPLAVGALALLAVPLSGQSIPEAAFDAWVDDVMTEWHVPGLAVAAVEDGEIVYAKGYGHRDVEAGEVVTPATLFAIGSNSKSFTVVLMGQLVDEGKLDWNAPVRDYLPDFALHDEYAAENMRVRDLVTHVSGLPRHDVLWYGRSLSRPEIFARLEHLEPTTTFRGRWQYQNLMFLTAGYLVERITGRSWDDLVRERIFEPLGMARSNASVKDMRTAENVAFPYVYDREDDELTKVPFRDIDNVAPAGSINSSVEEMANYIRMQINLGEFEGTRILEEGNASMMQQPQSLVGAPMEEPELGPLTYGLGLMVSTYRGHKVVSHGGGIDGFISAMAWLPNDSIGVMVLTNMSGEANPVPALVRDRVFDELLGYEPIDWNARVREDIEEGRTRQAEREMERAGKRVEGTSPSHLLEAYAGTYSHPGYGDIEVRLEDGGLHVTFDTFEMALEHYHYDVFEIDAGVGEDLVPLSGRVMFHMDKDGEIVSLGVPLEPALRDIEFEKRTDEERSEGG